MPSHSASLISILLAVAVAFATPAQETRERDSAKLIPNFLNFSDPGFLSLAAPEVMLADTPVAVRSTFFFVVTGWDTFALCDPADKALNFWGQRERLPKEVCEDDQTPGLLFAYSLIRASEREFFEQANGYKRYMVELGFDPEDRSTDTTTAVGMANVIGTRLADWAAKDGWNSLGDLTRNDFRQRFEDYTGYTPMNTPWELDYPLRWQPLVQDEPRIGRFTTQTHVVPFLGQVRPLLISREEAQARQAPMPYENMNATELSGKDKETMDALVSNLFEVSAQLTSEQRYHAIWWDNKMMSAGYIFIALATNERFEPEFRARWGLSEMLATYDAMVLAWKEKRRIDAVRPESIIAKYYKDEMVRAYVPKEGKVKLIKAGDWEPLIPTQPHSEYPSASAALCTAIGEQGELMMRELMEAKGIDKEIPFRLTPYPGFYPPGYNEGLGEIRFETMKEAAKSCGISRLWAGVHFAPSIPAGENLVKGLGQKAYDFVNKLAAGEVPENCWWCKA